MAELFFELIQISIGIKQSLSHLPSANEWDELFELAKKQSLVGITFMGLQRLGANVDDGFATIGMSEDTYFTWAGVAAKIHVRNEIVNHQCAVIHGQLKKDGFDCLIIKGQSAAKRYRDLTPFRQSGDIDVLLSGTYEENLRYVKQKFDCGKTTYNHAHVNAFSDTEVEAHFTPSWLYSPIRNKRLQQWFESQRLIQYASEDNISNGFRSPTVEFDLVYLMLHSFRHLMHEGLSLRQVMDYYFTMKDEHAHEFYPQTMYALQQFGIDKFAGAMMFVIQQVFGLEDGELLCKPDVKRGKRLLAEIEKTGTCSIGNSSKSSISSFYSHFRRQCNFLRDYPSEVLWSPVWKVWHFFWRKNN